MNENIYFQPDFSCEETLITPDGVELWSYYVYASFDNARRDFPDRQIIAYKGDDIEDPYFIDGDGNEEFNENDTTEYVDCLGSLKKVINGIHRQEVILWFNENDIDYFNMTDLDMYIYYIEKNAGC